MKRAILLWTIICLSFSVKAGCDMCSLYIGVHPNQVNRGITLRYRYSQFQTNHLHNHDVEHNHNNSSNETYIREYQSVELWTQWMPFRKLQVLAMVPYSMNAMLNNGQVVDAYNHVGDAQIIGRYQIFRSQFDTTTWQHRIVLGMGLKMPTGNYLDSSQLGYLDQHLQTGTGSWDIILNLGYLIKFKKWGYNQEVFYKYNTTNRFSFQFAPQLNFNGNLYYQYSFNDWTAIPSIGYLLEHGRYDHYNGSALETSNGTALYTLINLDVYWKQFGIQGSYQSMTKERFNDPSLRNASKWMLGLSYNF